MQAHRIETTVAEDGVITLRNLPFHEGEAVDVIVFSHRGASGQHVYPLRGKPVEFAEPLEPVGDEDWQALQ
ncbi:MAG: hypothetical protein WCD79_11500 [Chthoniobacteraceae bacterium]